MLTFRGDSGDLFEKLTKIVIRATAVEIMTHLDLSVDLAGTFTVRKMAVKKKFVPID